MLTNTEQCFQYNGYPSPDCVTISQNQLTNGVKNFYNNFFEISYYEQSPLFANGVKNVYNLIGLIGMQKFSKIMEKKKPRKFVLFYLYPLELFEILNV